MKKNLFSGIRFSFGFVHFLISSLIFLGIVYIFGYFIIFPGLGGSDNANFVSLAAWLYKWFPRVPFWYPAEGGGMSFTASYPILTHILTVFVAKIFSLNIVVAFRVFALLTAWLIPVGIYLLTLRLTKNKTVAFLAGVFYPISPIAWVWLSEWGFFAEQASHWMVPISLIFIDLYLMSVYGEEKGKRIKVYLLLSVIASGFTLLAHPTSFFGLVSLVAPFSIIYPLFIKDNNGKKLVAKSFLSVVKLFILVGLVTSFWLVPYQRYQNAVADGASKGGGVDSQKAFVENALYFTNFFNLTTERVSGANPLNLSKARNVYAWHNIAFPFPISILALLGLVGAFFLNKKLFSYGMSMVLALVVVFWTNLAFFLRHIPILVNFSSWRAMIIPARIFVPVLAAFGCFFVAYLLSFPVKFVIGKIKNKFVFTFSNVIYGLICLFITLGVAFAFLYRFRNWPDNPPYLLSYGLDTVSIQRNFDTRDPWKKENDYCQARGLVPSNALPIICSNVKLQETFWPNKLALACKKAGKNLESLPSYFQSLCTNYPTNVDIDKAQNACSNNPSQAVADFCYARVGGLAEELKPPNWLLPNLSDPELTNSFYGKERAIFTKLPDNNKTRLDVGTSLGGFMMIAPYYTSMPELPSYFNQGSLMSSLWNYELTTFYNEDSAWKESILIDELSKYFGIEYSLLSKDLIPKERYSSNWQDVYDYPTGTYGGISIWKFNQPTGLLTAATKPVILVIGQDKFDAYFRIFHLGNLGAIPYDEAILVKGSENVDDYSYNDFKQFDAVILEGYKYKSKNKTNAWNELGKYVKSGGALFINTGWQYTSADWQLSQAPDFFPTNSLEWTTASGTYNLDSSLLGETLDPSLLSPLISGTKPWSVSTSSMSQLKPWAKVVLSSGDRPLIALGNYGSGEVVWTGLDLPGHIGAYANNPEEVKLYSDLIRYLIGNKQGKALASDFSRNYPDKVTINVNDISNQKAVVYWREAYYSDFKATLLENGTSKSIQTYKAGPGMALFIIPSGIGQNAQIIYQYKTPLVVLISDFISLITVILLTLGIFSPKFFDSTEKFLSSIRGRLSLNKLLSEDD